MRVSVKYVIKIAHLHWFGSCEVRRSNHRRSTAAIPGCADPNAISCFAWIDSAAILQKNLTHSIWLGSFQPDLTGNVACLYHRHSCAAEIESSSALQVPAFLGAREKVWGRTRARARTFKWSTKPNQKNSFLTGACRAGGKDWVSVADDFFSRIGTVS